MRPLKFAFADFDHTPLPYDRFLMAPEREFSIRQSILVPEHKHEYDDTPFLDRRLRKTIGHYVDNINKAMDPDNQITVHMPDIRSREIILHSDKLITHNHARDSLERIFGAYSVGQLKRYNATGLIHETVFAAKPLNTSFTPAASAPPAIFSDKVIEKYLRGFSEAHLLKTEISFDSFDFDHAHDDMREHVFEISEDNNARSNMPVYHDEKLDSKETREAFDRHWNINFFEGNKAASFNALKTFLQNQLSVEIDISGYSSSRVELRGQKDNVSKAKQIGIRAVPLINEGKIIDQIWLENALTDVKTKIAIGRICETQGTYYSDVEARKAQYKAGLKGFDNITPAFA